jgi:anti-sigma factor RsiW
VSSAPVSEVDLTSFLDGELAPERRPAVEIYLAAHPAEASRIEGWRRQNELIRAALGRVTHEPPPIKAGAHGQPVLRLDPGRLAAQAAHADAAAPIRLPDVRPQPIRPARLAAVITGSFLAGAASAVVAVMLFGLTPNLLSGLGMMTGRPVESRLVTDFGPALAARAIEAHVTYAAEQSEPDLVPAALAESLSTRLGLAVPVPDLTSFNLRLSGGRLAPADIGPAAFITYLGPQGERIGFLATRAPGEDGLRFAQGRGASVAIWSAAGMGYAVSGSSDKARLLTIAESIRAKIEPR